MRKKHYFGRGVMFLLCLIFAVAFLLPTVLTITNSFMSESEINSNYGMVFETATGGYVSKHVNLKFIPDKVSFSQYDLTGHEEVQSTGNPGSKVIMCEGCDIMDAGDCLFIRHSLSVHPSLDKVEADRQDPHQATVSV